MLFCGVIFPHRQIDHLYKIMRTLLTKDNLKTALLFIFSVALRENKKPARCRFLISMLFLIIILER